MTDSRPAAELSLTGGSLVHDEQRARTGRGCGAWHFGQRAAGKRLAHHLQLTATLWQEDKGSTLIGLHEGCRRRRAQRRANVNTFHVRNEIRDRAKAVIHPGSAKEICAPTWTQLRPRE